MSSDGDRELNEMMHHIRKYWTTVDGEPELKEFAEYVLGLIKSQTAKAVLDERRTWLVVTRRVYNPKTGKPDYGRVPIGFFDDMHKLVEAELKQGPNHEG